MDDEVNPNGLSSMKTQDDIIKDLHIIYLQTFKPYPHWIDQEIHIKHQYLGTWYNPYFDNLPTKEKLIFFKEFLANLCKSWETKLGIFIIKYNAPLIMIIRRNGEFNIDVIFKKPQVISLVGQNKRIIERIP